MGNLHMNEAWNMNIQKTWNTERSVKGDPSTGVEVDEVVNLLF